MGPIQLDTPEHADPLGVKIRSILTPVGKKTRTNNTWQQTIHIKPNEIIKKEETSISMAKP